MGLWDEVEEIAVDDLEIPNKYLDNYEEGMKLLSSLLATNSIDSELDKKLEFFYKLIQEDYMKFSSKEGLPNEVEVYNKLLKLKDSVQGLVKSPFLTGKCIVAVGGGFSAGKSRFINSILKDEILPTDTRPTTSIPTYISKGNRDLIYCVNIFGSKTEIDQEGVFSISHAFYEKYKLSFTKILKNILIQSLDMPYNHVVFLDTPGYTKAEFHKKEDNTDENIAREHLATADYLIWLVDIEKGTIPNQDLEFIKTLEFQKPIFFVFTKGDKKQESDIRDILEVAEKNIRDSNINIEGITAYSSVDQKEYIYNRLGEFLDKVNYENKESKLLDEISEIFDVYRNYSEQKLEHKKQQLAAFNKLAIFSKDDGESPIINEFRVNLRKDIAKEKNFSGEIIVLKNKFDSSIIDILKQISKDMKKGQNVDLTRINPKLSKLLVELGWDDNSCNGVEIDLNLSVFLLNDKDKVDFEEDFVFYNNLISKDSSVTYTGDFNGKVKKSKQVKVNLPSVNNSIKNILFTSDIYEAEERGQNFGQVSNAYIRILDEETNKEIVRYNLGEENLLGTNLIFGKLIRNRKQWDFNAIAKASNESLADLCRKYGLDVG